MIATIQSSTVDPGVDHRDYPNPLTVEVHADLGLPGFYIIGLPDGAAREMRDRVRAAFITCGIPWPMRKVVVNVWRPSPPVTRHGMVHGRYRRLAQCDLAVALGILVATGEIPPIDDRCIPSTVLHLDGRIGNTSVTLAQLVNAYKEVAVA